MTSSAATRWEDHFVTSDFRAFWSNRALQADVRLLVIAGVGFDPRSLVALKLLAQLEWKHRPRYLALTLRAPPALGEDGGAADRLVSMNVTELGTITQLEQERVFDVETHDADGHPVSGRRTLSAVAEMKTKLSSYTDVLVDISGMPRGAFFPLISYLVHLANEGQFRNLHVAVVEDPMLDSHIHGREFGQADYLHTFRWRGEGKVVWLPVVGAKQAARLDKIYGMLRSACIEICPILPFPALSLRRADEIAVEHAELMFERLQVSMDNLLLCDERTPFDVYRKVLDVEEYYRDNLGALPGVEGVTTVLSPLSSKTLSLGLLLAGIERKLPICHVEPGSYVIDVSEDELLANVLNREPTEVWLTGEPYE